MVYSTLKAAVVHYTRCLAKELMDDGVRVNAVSPGPTKTARFQATRTVDPGEDGFAPSARSTAMPSRTRSPTPWPSSPGRARRFINGQVIRVDGGLTLFPG